MERPDPQHASVKKAKPRLVVHGYRMMTEVSRDSLTLSEEGRATVLQSIASCQWKLRSFDISTAFLRGKADDRNRSPRTLAHQRGLGIPQPDSGSACPAHSKGLHEFSTGTVGNAASCMESGGFINTVDNMCLKTPLAVPVKINPEGGAPATVSAGAGNRDTPGCFRHNRCCQRAS